MQDVNALEGKSIAELREIAKVLGITDTTLLLTESCIGDTQYYSDWRVARNR